MLLKEEPIRSQKYLRGAKGSPCTFNGPTCNHDDSTTIPAHLNGAAFGKAFGMKAHDIATLDACFDCHVYIDVGHGTQPLISDAEFWKLLLRGVVRTMVNRVRRHIVIVPLDPEALASEREPGVKRPKKKAASRPIRQRGFDKTKTRHFDNTVTERRT